MRTRRNCSAKACVGQHALGTRRLAARTAHSKRETGKTTGTEKGRRPQARTKRPTWRRGTTQRAT